MRGNNVESLKDKASQLPLTPGVYLMKDSSGTIIYVGKSKKLRNRVQSYFFKNKGHSPKVTKLVQMIKDFDYILTDTEFEAFLLECQLIQEIMPYFNRKMKTPNAYAYIAIKSMKGRRCLEIAATTINKSDTTYFGPFTSRFSAERFLEILKDFYKIDCTNLYSNGRTCLNYSLHKCMGICLGDRQILKEYENIMDKISDLLNGNSNPIINDMTQEMKIASEDYQFEMAAKIKNNLQSLQILIKREMAAEFAKKNKCFFVVEKLEDTKIKYFLIRGNQVLYMEKIDVHVKNMKTMSLAIREKIIHYFKEKSQPNVNEIIEKAEIDEAQIIYRYLESNQGLSLEIEEDLLELRNTQLLDHHIKEILSCLN